MFFGVGGGGRPKPATGGGGTSGCVLCLVIMVVVVGGDQCKIYDTSPASLGIRKDVIVAPALDNCARNTLLPRLASQNRVGR